MLFAAALAARWPYLQRLPHFTDEVVEVRWALRIWRGEILPLTASDHYYGPLHAYIVAACLWLFGPSMVLPRAIVMVLGALTVVATYLLGRELAGRWAGLLGATLLATAPQHIVVNSHVAWQNSTTPFYATLCCWALARALRRLPGAGAAGECGAGGAEGWRRWAPAGRWLVLAGALYGLVLQTHPGTIVLAPALAATVLVALFRRRGDGAWGLLRTPWPYAAVLAGLVTYGPVLVFNLTNQLSGVVRVQTRREYAYVSDPSWQTYRENLANLQFELARLISNPMRLPERPLHYLTSPYMAVMVALALAGLALLARRGQWLPSFAFLSTAAIMPYVNRAYGQPGDRYMLTGRYVAYLLPFADVAVAVAVLALSGWALRSVRGRWPRWAPVVGAVPLVLGATLVLYPLQPLGRYYTHESGKDPDNASFLELVRILDAHRGPRAPVLVEYDLRNVDLKDGADAREIIVHLLTLRGVPHTVTHQPREDLRRLAAAADGDPEALPLIVMMRDGCWPLRDDVPLQRVSGRLRLRELYWTVPSYFAVYRYAPPPQPAACLPPAGPTPGD